MELKKIEQEFSICKVSDTSDINFDKKFYFVGKTDEEISIVCVTDDAPNNIIQRDDGWKAFKIQGILDFSLIGVLSRISEILAENLIGIFVISTYNTDYILTKSENYLKALDVLEREGYEIV